MLAACSVVMDIFVIGPNIDIFLLEILYFLFLLCFILFFLLQHFFFQFFNL